MLVSCFRLNKIIQIVRQKANNIFCLLLRLMFTLMAAICTTVNIDMVVPFTLGSGNPR